MAYEPPYPAAGGLQVKNVLQGGTVMSRSLLLLFSTVLLSSPVPPQDPQGDRDQKPVLLKSVRLANKKKLASMQGAWRLVEMRLVGMDTEGTSDLKMDQVGYCLVSGTYLSIELHIRVLGQGETDTGRSFVSGLHRFEIDPQGDLEMTTVIATRTDPRGNPEFEAPGTKRHYSSSVEGPSMTLTREDGHTLVFEQLVDDTTRFDFFGRPVTEKEQAAEDDIYNDEKKEKKDEGDEDGDEEQ